MRYRLRALLILMAVGPPTLAGTWVVYQRVAKQYRKSEFDRLADLIQKTVKPTPWDHVGGPRSIDDFTENLNIIVGSGQVVHEQPDNNE